MNIGYDWIILVIFDDQFIYCKFDQPTTTLD